LQKASLHQVISTVLCSLAVSKATPPPSAEGVLEIDRLLFVCFQHLRFVVPSTLFTAIACHGLLMVRATEAPGGNFARRPADQRHAAA
jgi:hypothetical protein